MQISTAPTTVPVSSRLSPIEVWQILLKHLLAQHYGLTLNDTPFSDESTIREHINAGISLSNAVNFIVEKYELVRTDRSRFTILEQSPFITSSYIADGFITLTFHQSSGPAGTKNVDTGDEGRLLQEQHLR